MTHNWYLGVNYIRLLNIAFPFDLTPSGIKIHKTRVPFNFIAIRSIIDHLSRLPVEDRINWGWHEEEQDVKKTQNQ